MSKIQTEAFYITKVGSAEESFKLMPLELQAPGQNEVIIEVESFVLNYADVMARRGLYREAPPFPCVVGYEVVGHIVSVGNENDHHLIGKRVIGFCRFGGYARHAVTFNYAVVEVGDQPANELLALCTQGVTAYYMAVYLSPVHEVDTVLVHAAAGGVGSILIQLAKLRGAKVIAKVGSDNKRNVVEGLGADFVVNYNQSDYVKEIQNYLGADRLDISYNPVAGSTYKKDMSLLGSGGRMILFGGSELASGKWGILSKLNFVRKMGLVFPIGLMMRSKSLLGVNMLKVADNKPNVLAHCLNAVVKLYEDGKIKPQSGGSFSSENLNEAHESLESGKTTGKLSIDWV